MVNAPKTLYLKAVSMYKKTQHQLTFSELFILNAKKRWKNGGKTGGKTSIFESKIGENGGLVGKLYFESDGGMRGGGSNLGKVYLEW